MVRKSQEWPDEGELIVGTVYKVLNYGAFAKLEEYQGKEAFIHISEVSSGWVKNIRDHVRENQKIVCRVLRVNPKKGHVDASLKRIREDQRTKKIQHWKIEQKAEKFLELGHSCLCSSWDLCSECFLCAILKLGGTQGKKKKSANSFLKGQHRKSN